MKVIVSILFLAILIIGCKNQEHTKDKHLHQEIKTSKEEAPKKKVLSPHTSAMTMVGDAHIHIDYSSPGVRGRIIFGGLLAYDQVWQSGAHMATWIETNKDLQINGKILPAGKYGFFTIPSKDEWTVIFNSNWEQHGKDEYDEKAYVSLKDGKFQTVRHRSWRWFDFLWMTHTMDYEGRDNFNTVVLRAFSLLGLITVLSGFLLWYTSSPSIRKLLKRKKIKK